MGQKVTFDPITKIIQVDVAPVDGEVRLDIQVDVYSDGKEDWRAGSELFKRRFPVRVVGGDPRPGDDPLGSSYFLNSAWKIRPYEGDHIFIVSGNFYAEDGSSPFIPTAGSYNVFMSRETSNIVDKVSSGSGLDTGQDAALTRILALEEADEIHNPTSIVKKVKGTETVLLNKDVSGSNLSSEMTVVEAP